jgi:hypothetical protein
MVPLEMPYISFNLLTLDTRFVNDCTRLEPKGISRPSHGVVNGKILYKVHKVVSHDSFEKLPRGVKVAERK